MKIRSKKSHLILGFFSLIGLAGFLVPLPALYSPAEPTDRTIRIEASSFAYEPGVIKVNPDDRVTLELVSTDVVHGLYLDGYDLEVVADPGQTRTLTFTADRTGSFRFRCSVTCGTQHPFMIGQLKVGANPYLWRGGGLALLAVFGILWAARYESD
jgi:heme/copper-type cytochrome/quinol oxidase subunit 2